MNNYIPASAYCKKIFDGTHDTPKPVLSGLPLITSKNILGGILNLKDSYNISEVNYTDIQKRSKVSQWDILFSMIGSVGEIYLEKSLNIPYAIKNVGVFSCDDEYKAKWLYYYFKSPQAKQYIQNYQNGAVQKFLPLGTLRSFPVLPYDDKYISCIDLLFTLDSEIELNNHTNAELEGMAKTLYDYWFTQFDFPNENGKPYKTSGGRMVWNQELKREIPEGWEVCRLGDIGNFKNGVNYDPSNPGDIACPIINVRNISSSSYFLKNEDLDIIYLRKSDVKKYSVHNGSIIIARSGIPGATRLIADIAENTLYCGFAIHYELENLDFKIPIFFYLKSIEYQIQNGSGGTIMKNVNQATLNALSVCLPKDKSLLTGFNNLIQPIFDKISLIQIENQKLAELRDWLLPMLINGQVKVN